MLISCGAANCLKKQIFDYKQVMDTLIGSVITEQSLDVDAVSGATYSSNGIKEAVANALSLDYTPSTVQNEGRGGFRH